MMNTRQNSIERSGWLVDRKFIEYLWPTLAMSASLFLASIVDSIMVGNLLGANELAAINLTNSVVFIKNIVFSLFVYGGSTLATGFIGKRDRKNAHKAFTWSIGVGVVVSALMALLGSLFSKPLSYLLTGGGELYAPVLSYIVPCWISGPFIVFNSGMAAYVRADGQGKIASALPIVSNLINLSLDYVLMRFTSLGIAGAGWATVLGYILGSALLISYFRSPERSFHFTRISLSESSLLWELLATGLPSALLQVCNLIRTFSINTILLHRVGTAGLQVVSVCISAYTVSLIFISGVGSTMLPLSAALAGERDSEGLKFVLRRSLILSEGAAFLILILFELFPLEIGAIYGLKSIEAMDLLESAFRLYSLCIPLVGIAFVFRSFWQATGQKAAASFFTALDGAIVTVPVFFVFSFISDTLMWLSFAIGELISILIMYLIMRLRAKIEGRENFLMLEPVDSGKSLDFSIDSKIETAVEASSYGKDFCLENGVSEKNANVIALSLEELCVNIAKYAVNTKKIDVLIRITESEILLRVRDNGNIFNPTEYVDDSGREITGLKLLQSLKADLSYDRVIGFNETIVRVRP